MKNKDIYTSEMSKQIAGLTLLNKVATEELHNIIPQLTGFIGTKILTASGMSKKFVIEILKNEPTKRAFVNESFGSLYLNIDIHIKETEYEGGGYGVRYFKKVIWLGKVSNDGKLLSIEPVESIIENYGLNQAYDVPAIRAEKQAIKELEAKIEELKTDFRKYQFDESVLKYD